MCQENCLSSGFRLSIISVLLHTIIELRHQVMLCPLITYLLESCSLCSVEGDILVLRVCAACGYLRVLVSYLIASNVLLARDEPDVCMLKHSREVDPNINCVWVAAINCL